MINYDMCRYLTVKHKTSIWGFYICFNNKCTYVIRFNYYQKVISFLCKIFSVFYLKFFAANISETITDELMQRWYGPDTIVAEIRRRSGPPIQMKMSDVPITEKLEKFVEDVK